jgi:hypothetical protein
MNLDHIAGPILRTSDHKHVGRSSSLIRQVNRATDRDQNALMFSYLLGRPDQSVT